MLGYLVLTEKQSVLATPIPALAGPGPAELGLHSIHSTDYASHWFDASLRLTPSGLPRKIAPGDFFSPAFIGSCPAPSLGIL